VTFCSSRKCQALLSAWLLFFCEMYLSMCVLMARCGGLEVISLCACARVCLRPAALERPQQLYRGLPCRKNEANWSENLLHKKREKTRAHKRVFFFFFFFHTFVRSSSTHSAVARRHAHARGGERRRETHLPPTPSRRGRRIGRVSYERARILSLC